MLGALPVRGGPLNTIGYLIMWYTTDRFSNHMHLRLNGYLSRFARNLQAKLEQRLALLIGNSNYTHVMQS